MNILTDLLLIPVSYLIGSIPAGFILVKLLKGVDIRNFGSGSTGATNVKRILGLKWAIIILLFDALKGVAAILLAKAYATSEWFVMLSAVLVIAGHIYSVFLSFKAGKGVATSIGVLLVFLPVNLLIFLGIFLLTVVITRYISLGSILGALSLPISVILMGKNLPVVVFALICAGVVIYNHKNNIQRILKGNEDKFTFKKR